LPTSSALTVNDGPDLKLTGGVCTRGTVERNLDFPRPDRPFHRRPQLTVVNIP
jgi:hypothetical protein